MQYGQMKIFHRKSYAIVPFKVELTGNELERNRVPIKVKRTEPYTLPIRIRWPESLNQRLYRYIIVSVYHMMLTFIYFCIVRHISPPTLKRVGNYRIMCRTQARDRIYRDPRTLYIFFCLGRPSLDNNWVHVRYI